MDDTKIDWGGISDKKSLTRTHDYKPFVAYHVNIHKETLTKRIVAHDVSPDKIQKNI